MDDKQVLIEIQIDRLKDEIKKYENWQEEAWKCGEMNRYSNFRHLADTYERTIKELELGIFNKQVLKILKNRKINLTFIKESPKMDYEQFIFTKDDLLIEEEFNLIKEWLNE